MRPFALLLLLAPALGQFPLPRAQPQLLEQGRRELGRVQELSLQPGTGQCWRRALGLAEGSCQELGQEQHNHIALEFTRCHLESSGKSFPTCPEGCRCSVLRPESGLCLIPGVHGVFHTRPTASVTTYKTKCGTSKWRRPSRDCGSPRRACPASWRQLTAWATDIMAAQNVTLRAQDQVLRHGEALKATLQGFHARGAASIPGDAGLHPGAAAAVCRSVPTPRLPPAVPPVGDGHRPHPRLLPGGVPVGVPDHLYPAHLLRKVDVVPAALAQCLRGEGSLCE
ncbi:uncharacterized protein [Chiloscyllium punctatum]|uniref:uncharacterized protein isoform X1 n=1 Tax=Chiloscyllium punctatum TaxID=137246 RepID=UPI003B6337D5